MCEKDLQIFVREMEKDITEIMILGSSSLTSLNTSLTRIEKECLELRKILIAQNQEEVEQQQVEQEEAGQQQRRQEEGFTCSSCSVTKPIDQRERVKENKNQVFVNSVLITDLRNVANSLEIMEHLDMNVFVEVHFRDGG